MENGTDAPQHGGSSLTHSRDADVTKKRPHNGRKGHESNSSGGILEGLPFLRASSKDPALRASRDREEGERSGNEGDGAEMGSYLASALHQSKGRRRKASLRKGILGKNMMRERRNSQPGRCVPAIPVAVTKPTNTHMLATPSEGQDEATPHQFNYSHAALNSSSETGWPVVTKPPISVSSTALSAGPIASPTARYASTTDDDEDVSFFQPPSQGAVTLQRRRSNRSAVQPPPAIVSPSADLRLDDDWDYSETEWWGWVVLIVTWLVFVVGMGSCLGVWSWAWDVGETPYAPPELEDDPTLPITGYYPALMVCTAVMAWVWVVVAWVGMKYFRHAKVVSEDG